MKYKHALGCMLARIRFLCSCQVDLLQCNHARIGDAVRALFFKRRSGYLT
jgi:hypothetical protein